MTDQNQGASIEAASRAEFEAEVRELDLPADASARWPDGRYLQEPIESMWSGWQMARRTPAAATGDGELPPLPVAAFHTQHGYVWLADQMRDYARAAIAADRAQRQAAFDAAVSLAGDTINARNAEIADLRAQLAAKGQGEQQSNREDFAAWLAREMPPGTVIGDPAWWAPRILRAACAPNKVAAAIQWISTAQHGDNCFVSDHYEGDPGNRCNCGKDSVLEFLESDAAPASARPADLAFADAVAYGTGILQGGKHVPYADFFIDPAGAQPDQRDSAAEAVWTSFDVALPPDNTCIFWRQGEQTGSGFFYAEDVDQWRPAYWMLPPPLAAAPSPAAQPAKEMDVNRMKTDEIGVQASPPALNQEGGNNG
jgi:hypothetical protein